MNSIAEKILEFTVEHIFPMLLKHAPTLVKSTRELQGRKGLKMTQITLS